MKKTMLFFFLSILTISSVLAVREPILTIDATITQEYQAQQYCTTDGIDKIYCLGGGGVEPNYLQLLKTYDTVAKDYSLFLELNLSYGNQFNMHGLYWYDPTSKLYATNDYSYFVVNRISIDEPEEIQVEGQHTELGYRPSCNLRPGSDEIWCFKFLDGDSTDGAYKYDIGDDTFTFVTPFTHPAGASTWMPCIPRNNEEMWCIGGISTVGYTYRTDFVVYNMETGAVDTSRNADVGFVSGYWVFLEDDILYGFGPEIDIAPTYATEDIYYYDPALDEWGTLNTTLIGGGGMLASPGGATIGNDVYLIGGWINDWADGSYNVLKLSFPPLCEPEWECVAYSDVCYERKASCIAVNDINSCGENYTGDYTEFKPQNCVIKTSGGSGDAVIIQDNLQKQAAQSSVCQTTDNTGEVIVCNTNQFFSRLGTALQQVILNIRKAVGLQ